MNDARDTRHGKAWRHPGLSAVSFCSRGKWDLGIRDCLEALPRAVYRCTAARISNDATWSDNYSHSRGRPLFHLAERSQVKTNHDLKKKKKSWTVILIFSERHRVFSEIRGFSDSSPAWHRRCQHNYYSDDGTEVLIDNGRSHFCCDHVTTRQYTTILSISNQRPNSFLRIDFYLTALKVKTFVY